MLLSTLSILQSPDSIINIQVLAIVERKSLQRIWRHLILSQVMALSLSCAHEVQRNSSFGRRGGRSGRQNAVSTVRFLVNRNVMRQSTKQVQLLLKPAEDLFRWCEDFEEA